MKPSTNFKVIIGIFLLLFCAVSFYLLARDFAERSRKISNPDYGKNILKGNK